MTSPPFLFLTVGFWDFCRSFILHNNKNVISSKTRSLYSNDISVEHYELYLFIYLFYHGLSFHDFY